MGGGDQILGAAEEDAAVVCGQALWQVFERSFSAAEGYRYDRQLGEWRYTEGRREGYAASSEFRRRLGDSQARCGFRITRRLRYSGERDDRVSALACAE